MKKKNIPVIEDTESSLAQDKLKEEGFVDTKSGGKKKKKQPAAPGKKKNKKGSTILLVLIFVVGLGILLYPTVSNWWNSFHQSRAISNYAEAVSKISEEDYQRYLNDAYEYNEKVQSKKNQYNMSEQDLKDYESVLDVGGNGIIGYIEIEKIKVYLPIYHGTSESVLQIAVGHLDWTTFPVGGKSTHCVLSGHRGLPSAKLFTDLDEMDIGDTFVIRVLDEMYTYEVDQILIVLPSDTEALRIVDGEDFCTLVTCTPYGINSHRLLVRGHRVENAKQVKEVRVTNDATRIEPLIIAPIIAAPMLIILLVVVIINDRRRTKAAKRAKENMLSSDDDDNPFI